MNKHKVRHHRKSDTKTVNRDHIRTTAFTKFGLNRSIRYQDIEQKTQF